MSTKSFTDADGDTYTTQLSESGHNITITYQNPEESGVALFIFKTEDAGMLVNHIIATVLEAKK